MATGIGILDDTFIAGGDLTANLYFFVKKGTSGNQVVLAGDGEAALGILQNKPNTGQAAVVRLYGISPVAVGAGNVTEGDLVSSDAEGSAQTADGGDYVVAIALKGGTDDAALATVFLNGLCKI